MDVDGEEIHDDDETHYRGSPLTTLHRYKSSNNSQSSLQFSRMTHDSQLAFLSLSAIKIHCRPFGQDNRPLHMQCDCGIRWAIMHKWVTAPVDSSVLVKCCSQTVQSDFILSVLFIPLRPAVSESYNTFLHWQWANMVTHSYDKLTNLIWRLKWQFPFGRPFRIFYDSYWAATTIKFLFIRNLPCIVNTKLVYKYWRICWRRFHPMLPFPTLQWNIGNPLKYWIMKFCLISWYWPGMIRRPLPNSDNTVSWSCRTSWVTSTDIMMYHALLISHVQTKSNKYPVTTKVTDSQESAFYFMMGFSTVVFLPLPFQCHSFPLLIARCRGRENLFRYM